MSQQTHLWLLETDAQISIVGGPPQEVRDLLIPRARVWRGRWQGVVFAQRAISARIHKENPVMVVLVVEHEDCVFAHGLLQVEPRTVRPR